MSARRDALREPGAASPRPRLEIVRRRSRSLIQRDAPRRFAPVVVVAAIVAATAILGVLLEQVVLAQSAFKMSRLRTDLGEAEARHQELLLEATKLESPRRIERFARTELRLVEPQAVQYLVSDAALAGRNARGAKRGGGPARRAAAPYLAVQPSARLVPSSGSPSSSSAQNTHSPSEPGP
ncbi:MAG: cell division protein FtsL [Actinomycetota bacterium]|nr:cell division protein FtsL [Actinomycetota bacterium]